MHYNVILQMVSKLQKKIKQIEAFYFKGSLVEAKAEIGDCLFAGDIHLGKEDANGKVISSNCIEFIGVADKLDDYSADCYVLIGEKIKLE